MRKLYILCVIGLAALIIGLAWADQITLTTYYRAPYGVYNDMVVMNSLGIGTTSPATHAKLHAQGTTAYGGTQVGGAEDRPTLWVAGMYPNVIIASNGNTNHGSTLGFWSWDAASTTHQWNLGGGQSGNFSIGYATNNGNPHASINGYAPGNTYFQILPTGNVGIGDSTPTEATLVVNGTAGNFTGVWSNLSDRRLKKDIQPLEGSLSEVLNLQGVSFYWKDSERGEGLQRGFIAQDVEDVIPEWVKTDDDGYKRLEKVGVEALLVEAIKELNAKVESLEAQLNIGQ